MEADEDEALVIVRERQTEESQENFQCENWEKNLIGSSIGIFEEKCTHELHIYPDQINGIQNRLIQYFEFKRKF